MSRSKQQDQRGLRGPRGPRGAQGPIGRTGKSGAIGPRGRVGARGKAGPLSLGDRLAILSVVEGQIEEVHREVTVQMKRMANLQAEIDELRENVARLLADLPDNAPPAPPG